MAWQVVLEAIDAKRLEDFYRVWRKHDHGPRDEEILRRLHDWAMAGQPKRGQPVIATYGEKESVENVVAEVQVYGGTARVEELASPE